MRLDDLIARIGKIGNTLNLLIIKYVNEYGSVYMGPENYKFSMTKVLVSKISKYFGKNPKHL